MTFSNQRIIWMDNLHGMYVVAAIRGGGDYGELWHEAGTKEKRQNVFDDLISAAEFLQNEKKFTDSKHTALNGGSNGGTVVAACSHQRPDLFAAVVPEVPVTDMLRY